MRHLARTWVISACLGATLVAPAWGQAPAGLSAENVEFVKNIARHSDSAGAVLLGGYYYITTERDLSIYDVKDPENPVLAGNVVLDQVGMPVFTEEDPTTNGRILVVSNTDTLVYDVSDKTRPTLIGTLAGVEQHTMQCVLDCSWVYGSEGAVIDLRDPKAPKLAGSWRESLGVETSSTHDVTEVSPGILVTSTEPLVMLDARTDPAHPKVLATGKTPGFAHANLWPHGGTDDFLLVGGEATGPQCAEDPSATFMTFDARSARSAGTFTLIDEFRVPLGTIADGHMADSSFCVHWFDPHPTYANGGLVAIAWYEQGTRFLKIDAVGKITEVGHFLAPSSQASDVDWITPKVAYISDYLRGLDIVRYAGEIPQAFPKPTLGAPLPPASAPPAGRSHAKPSPARLLRLPSARKCIPARGLKLRLGANPQDPIVNATLRVGGRMVATARGGKGVSGGLASGRLKRGRRVTIIAGATTRSGARISAQRVYRVC